MVLTNFSKYHWPSQRMIVAILTIAVATLGVYDADDSPHIHTITAAVIVLGGLWLFFDSLFHVIELVSGDCRKLASMRRVADRSRPVFLAIVAAGNIFHAAGIVYTTGAALGGVVFLHIIHAVVFMYILVVDWYIDNSNKLQKAKYKRG